MPSSCYILYSKIINKYYVGATQETVELRLEKHNKHGYGKHRFTAVADDWNIYLIMETVDYSQAIRIERKIKSMKSRTYIENLNRYPELRQKLLDQTSI